MTSRTRSPSVPPEVTLVDLYRNLHTGTWSAMAKRGPPNLIGHIVAHPTEALLSNCTFIVRAKGRELVRATCSKNVHSVVRGTPAYGSFDWPSELVTDVGYNPYLFDSFVLLANAQPIRRAALVMFPVAGVKGAKPSPLRVALYPEDAGLLALPKVPIDAARLARMAWCRLSPAQRKASREAGLEPPIANPTSIRAAALACDWNGHSR